MTRLRVLKKDYELPRAKKQFKASTNSSLFREEGQHEFVDMKKNEALNHICLCRIKDKLYCSGPGSLGNG